MAHILLLTWGSGGDVAPLAHIGTGLKARGHEVTLFTHCIYQEQVSQAGLNFVALDTPEEARRYLQDKDEPIGPIDFASYFKQRVMPRIPREYQIMKPHYRRGDTILISLEPARVVAQMAAEKWNIPFVLLYVAPKDVGFKLGRFAMSKFNLERVDALFLEARASIGLPPLADRAAWERGVACRIGQWPQWFAPLGSDAPFDVKPIGFMLDQSPRPLPREVQAFLEAGPPPILITHGAGMPQKPQFFRASAEACQMLGYRAMLVTQHADLAPRSLPDGVQRFVYVPDASLMPHVRAVIHHGGMGTSGAAMLAGIPQLVLPFAFDRLDNAINLQRLGVGEFLRPSQWQADHIAEALFRLVNSPTVQFCCREIAGKVKKARPVAKACDIVEGVLAGANVLAESNGPGLPHLEPDWVFLENKLDDELRQRLNHLSPEKRALVGKKTHHGH